MKFDINDHNNYFFVGIAGTGMSAIAQYLKGIGKNVAGSDRLFSQTDKMLIQNQFEAQNIECYFQDGRGINANTEAVIVSTAIEECNVEYQKALELNIPIIKRSALLAAISNSIKAIALGGSSGKSTTTAMIFHVLEQCGKSPSLITGAGLSELQAKGLPGNAWNGTGEWLVIEADESDGSIISYQPEIGVVLNIERDHKELDELMQLFTTFKNNTKSQFIVNQNYKTSSSLSADRALDFCTCRDESCSVSSNKKQTPYNNNIGFTATDFKQTGFEISFKVNNLNCKVPVIGKHNMENAMAAIAVASAVGIDIKDAINALSSFKGIYRRTQLVGKNENKNIYVIDDFAHNPGEVAAAIRACQSISKNVIAYFQPHGFGPLKFICNDLSHEVEKALTKNDIFLIGDVYYAGGTVDKNISPTVVSDAIIANGKNAKFVGDKQNAMQEIINITKNDTVILIMGARDPNLDKFAAQILENIK